MTQRNREFRKLWGSGIWDGSFRMTKWRYPVTFDVGICSIYCTHRQMHHCPINLKVRQHVYFFQMLRFMFGEKFNLTKYPGLIFRDFLIKFAPLLQPNENFPWWASDSIYCTVAQHMKRRWSLNEMRIIQLSCHNSVTSNFFGDLFVIYPTKQLGLAMVWWKYPVLVFFLLQTYSTTMVLNYNTRQRRWR